MAHRRRAGGRRRSNGAVVLWRRGGASDGSESSSEVGWRSTTCAWERKGCEEGYLRWVASVRTEELTATLIRPDRRAVVGWKRCKEGALFIEAVHEAKRGCVGYQRTK
jgi:hypothetical protein